MDINIGSGTVNVAGSSISPLLYYTGNELWSNDQVQLVGKFIGTGSIHTGGSNKPIT